MALAVAAWSTGVAIWCAVHHEPVLAIVNAGSAIVLVAIVRRWW